MITPDSDQQSLEDEISDLDRRLQEAKSRLNVNGVDGPLSLSESSNGALHTLLLLADSALPLGSFAFSSGLESYLAHHRPSPPSASQIPSFHKFLHLSLSSLASTALPYTLAAYRHPELIQDLDNDFDASTPCTVARRASVAQGRALLSVWDRSFNNHRLKRLPSSPPHPTPGPPESQPNAHLAPLWGLLTCILGLPLHESAYLFLFSHARTVTSAAVRASVLGPYQAQAVLASGELREKIKVLVQEMWDTKVEDAGQSVPVMDVWVGRHEMLYSRIFNS
ncbi:hypothetical protein H2199_004352 [Coniosporium tulheliwenetii]|uniref:Uncharacterized protein n=1 Tax=Coniosporium tulheliwenetii TaxID=3383036 RepID=A0ACC2Z5D1_9PEZI|nr:hypothetical protein H2199_004352 [Cladosporium sp. JES 115]